MMMGRGMMQSQRLPNGAGFTIFKIKVTTREKRDWVLPPKLSEIGPSQQDTADNFSSPKDFFLTMNHMQWSINGRTFEMED